MHSLFLSLPLLYLSASLTPFLASILPPPSLPLSGFIDLDDGRYAVGGLNVSDVSSADFPYTRAYLNRSATTTGARKNDSSCVFNYKEHMLLVRLLLLTLTFHHTFHHTILCLTHVLLESAGNCYTHSLTRLWRRCFMTVVVCASVFISAFQLCFACTYPATPHQRPAAADAEGLQLDRRVAAKLR